MAYYRRIKELREDHDKTQRDIAAILGMPQSQYWRYVQGYRDIPTDILIDWQIIMALLLIISWAEQTETPIIEIGAFLHYAKQVSARENLKTVAWLS